GLARAERAASAGAASLQDAWRRLWGEPWSDGLRERVLATDDRDPAAPPDLTSWRQCRGGRSSAIADTEGLFTEDAPHSWLEHLLAAASGASPDLVGAVVTGEFSEAVGIGGASRSVGDHLQDRFPEATLMVEKAGRPGKLLAEGAAL